VRVAVFITVDCSTLSPWRRAWVPAGWAWQRSMRASRSEGKRAGEREELAAALRMSGKARQHLMDFGKRRGGDQRVADAGGSAGQVTCLDIPAGQGE
jgi:hypothetical protein